MDADRKPLVMIVEDEELLMRAVEAKLQKTGKEVVGCNSAEQALSMLATMPQLPDVIWLDYYLKDMNGLEFMSRLKAKPSWAAIPVVVVSNSASAEKVKGMMNMGVKKYFLKAESKLDDLVGVLEEVGAGKKGDKT